MAQWLYSFVALILEIEDKKLVSQFDGLTEFVAIEIERGLTQFSA